MLVKFVLLVKKVFFSETSLLVTKKNWHLLAAKPLKKKSDQHFVII